MFQYPSLTRVSKIHLPTLFISGTADALIPPAMMQELYQVQRLVQHNSLHLNKSKSHTLIKFLSSVRKSNFCQSVCSVSNCKMIMMKLIHEQITNMMMASNEIQNFTCSIVLFPVQYRQCMSNTSQILIKCNY